METNIVNSIKTAATTSGNWRKSGKNTSETKFDEVFNKSLRTKTSDDAGKSTYGKDSKLHKGNDLNAKESIDEKDSDAKDGNVEKTTINETDVQVLINLLLDLDIVTEIDNNELEGLSNAIEKGDSQLLGLGKATENLQNTEKLFSVLKTVNTEDKSGLLELLQDMDPNSRLDQLITDMVTASNDDAIDNNILTKLRTLLDGEDGNSFKEDLKAVIEQLKDKVSHTEENINSNSSKTKILMKSIKEDTYDSDNESSRSSLKEDKVLKSLLGEKEDSSNKAVSMAAHLNRFRQDINSNTESVNVPVVNRNTFNGDIVKAVKYMEVNSLKELTVNINPKELGAITIRITMEAGIMKANITAANKETLELLNSNVIELRNSLNNGEIKVQDVSINIYNDDTTYFSGNFESSNEGFSRNGQNHNQERRFNPLEIEEGKSVEAADSRDNNLSILA